MNREPMMPRETVYDAVSEMASPGSRILGTVDTDGLTAAAGDRATLSVNVEGHQVPALVPIDYALGYDIQRCHEIADNEDPDGVFYYALPEQFTYTGGQAQELASGLASLSHGSIFYDRKGDFDSVPRLLGDALLHSGHAVQLVPLRDEEAAPGNEQASISLYGFDLPIENPEQARGGELDVNAWYGAYLEGVASGKYTHDFENGTVMLKGDGLDDAVYDAMWKVFQDRFQWLGEKHPVSMEDAEEDFEKFLRSPNTIISAKFSEGRVECFTYLTGDLDALYWLNPEFISDPNMTGVKENQSLAFFPGIVANREGATAYSLPVISLLANTALDSNTNLRVVFENTNRSEEYIPRLIEVIINRIKRVKIERPELLDKTTYGCIQFGRKAVAEEVALNLNVA